MAGSPQYDPKQTALAFSREKRLEILSRITAVAAGLTAHGWQQLRQLIEAIELCADRDGRARAEVLATKCRWSERTLRRVVSSGRRVGLLRVTPTYDARGRSASVWLVAWDRAAVWAGSLSAGDGQVPVSGGQKRLAATGRNWPQPADLAGTDLLSEENNNKPSSSLSAPTGTAQVAGTENWEAEEVFLSELGVDQAARAIRVARAQGFSVALVQAISRQWREHGGGTEHAAWGPAALAWRLTNVPANLPADRGWPKASEAYARHVERLRRDERDREVAGRNATRRAELDAPAV